MAQGSIFSAKARTYLFSRAKSQEQEKIANRIFELDLNEREAKEVISRVPFINQSEKQVLFSMIDEQVRYNIRLEKHIHIDSPRGLVPLGDDGERRLVLKKFALSKVRTEAQYSRVMEIFATEEPVMHTYERLVDLGFLSKGDLELTRRIAEGKLEAYYDRRMGRSFRYSQEVEASSVATTGFEVDALKVEGEYGRIRHRLRGFHLPGAADFYGEITLDAGDQSLRPDDEAQLEYLSLEWRGKQSRFLIGDTVIGTSQLLLDREIRGLHYRNEKWFDSSVSTDFYLGAIPIPIDTLQGPENDSQAIFGIHVQRDLGKERSVSIGYQVARELEDSRGRESRILRFGHQAKMAEHLRLQTEFLSSYGDRVKDSYRSSFAADMRLDYRYGGDFALLHYARFGKDFFSPSGMNLHDLTQWEGQASFQQSWGQWDIQGHWMSDSSDPFHSSLDIYRPSIGIHYQSLFGMENVHGFYRFYSSEEESNDQSRLFRSRTHWTRVLKSGQSGQLEASYRHRYHRDPTISSGSNLETEWNLNARGYYLWFGQDLSPEVFYGEERMTDIIGRKDLRRKGGAQLSFSFLGKNRAFARYSAWRSQSPIPGQDQRGKILDMRMDFPISSSGGKKLRLSYQWEEQNLADSLSLTAYREARIAYENLF